MNKTNKTVLFLSENHDNRSFELVKRAVSKTGARLLRLRRKSLFRIFGEDPHRIKHMIQGADLIIFDWDWADRRITYLASFAEAVEKPILLVSYGGFAISPKELVIKMFYYDDVHGSLEDYIPRLREIIKYALKNPSLYIYAERSERGRKVFISYSHKDAEFLERLLVHLRPLAKAGVIDLWVDTMIQPGGKWRKEIEQALSVCEVAILLVSADFLSSDFINENELPPLLAKAEEVGKCIIPIIIEPCRFSRDQRLNQFQAINDPSSPLSAVSHAEQEKILDKVAELLEQQLK